MNNNINIAELLKDCPKGTKLYSTIFGEVELKEVKNNGRSVCIFVTNFYGQEEMFYPDGKYNTHYSDSECTLFPSKEQRDWSKFCPFKDGDVLSGDNKSVFIFKSRKFIKCLNNYAYTSHCLFVPLAPLYVNPGGYRHTVKAVSFATEEEKQKLFQAIKDNGYRWNADTKTLEKWVEPKFKDGDIVATNSGMWIGITTGCVKHGFIPTYCVLKGNGKFKAYFEEKEKWCFDRLATEEEKQKLFKAIKDNGYKWNEETKTLEKLPKFKEGDRIQGYGTHINHPIRVVKSLEWDRYRLDNDNYIKFGDEHAYKLLKFNIATLKPFESKVLARDDDDEKWRPGIWGFYDNGACFPYKLIGDMNHYCIPYEGNQHLLGTTNDCDDYYKTWKDETDE